jgi:5'(3')-deoxyribonucleotidase
MRIGVDLGRVVIGGEGDDTIFSDDYLGTPEVEGAYKSVSKLSKGHELHIISKCGPVVEEKSMDWLDAEGFFYLILPHRANFVRKRHLKAPMAQALQLDIFIDDRQDVLDHMEGIVAHRILFTSWEQTNQELEKIFNETG